MPNWTEPFASLNTTLTFSGSGWLPFQYGSVVDYEHVMDSHAVNWNATLGTPAVNNARLALQGSLDGTNFYDLGDLLELVGADLPPSSLLVVNTMPARYVRAAVAMTDSGSITVSALLIAHE